MKILIVGCGLGGLSCALSCLQEGLEVEILEKAAEIGEIGAGIQMPPNATKVMEHYGLLERLRTVGAIRLEDHEMLQYSTGEIITSKPGPPWWLKQFGQYWYVIHRADYHRILYERASELGAKIRTGCNVVDVDFDSPCVFLEDGERIDADVVVGADGLWSYLRQKLVGDHEGPVETGDLAYRATIPRSLIEELNDPSILTFMDKPTLRNWVGPNRHAVLYPVRHKNQFNLVLLRPDDLPSDVATAIADVQEMKDEFKDWDSRLTTIISRIENVLKWKIRHMDELSSWTKGSFALLGDACHPSLPYQAQGAAMAVEDGATLGVLLGRLNSSPLIDALDRTLRIPDILRLYEKMRKSRTSLNVQGSAELQKLFHMPDGPASEARNSELRSIDWYSEDNKCSWNYGDMKHQKSLMGFNAIQEAREQFDAWVGSGTFK